MRFRYASRCSLRTGADGKVSVWGFDPKAKNFPPSCRLYFGAHYRSLSSCRATKGCVSMSIFN